MYYTISRCAIGCIWAALRLVNSPSARRPVTTHLPSRLRTRSRNFSLYLRNTVLALVINRGVWLTRGVAFDPDRDRDNVRGNGIWWLTGILTLFPSGLSR